MNGVYHAVYFSKESNKLLNEITKKLNKYITKKTEYDFHCTITYSTKDVPFYKDYSGGTRTKTKPRIKNKINKKLKIKSFGTFKCDDGLNLHLKVECNFCEMQHKKGITQGATYNFDEYIPHISLADNFKGDIISDEFKEITDMYIGKQINIIREEVGGLDE